jgi:hypothetical protein
MRELKLDERPGHFDASAQVRAEFRNMLTMQRTASLLNAAGGSDIRRFASEHGVPPQSMRT